MESAVGDVANFIQHVCTFCQFTTTDLPILVKHINEEHLQCMREQPQHTSNTGKDILQNVQNESENSISLVNDKKHPKNEIFEGKCESDTSSSSRTTIVNVDKMEKRNFMKKYQEKYSFMFYDTNNSVSVQNLSDNDSRNETNLCDTFGSNGHLALGSTSECSHLSKCQNDIPEESGSVKGDIIMKNLGCSKKPETQTKKQQFTKQELDEEEHSNDNNVEMSRPKRTRKPNSLYENYEIRKPVKKSHSKSKYKEKIDSVSKPPPELSLMQKCEYEGGDKMVECSGSEILVTSKHSKRKSVPPKDLKKVEGTDEKISHIQEARQRACVCAFCFSKFQTVSEVFEHYHTIHNYSYESRRPKRNVKESSQDEGSNIFKEIENKELMKSNESDLSVTNKKSKKTFSVCPHCEKPFLKDNLEMHIQLKHIWKSVRAKEQSGLHTCEHCGKVFSYKRNLKFHVQVHHLKSREPRKINNQTKKTFICEQCGYTTPENRRLKMHVLSVHQGIYPYVCNQCDFRTHERSSFRDHKLRHATEKPYKCDLCSYQCIQRGSLRYHTLHQHGIRIPTKYVNPKNTKAYRKDHVNATEETLKSDNNGTVIKKEQDRPVNDEKNVSPTLIKLLNELPLNEKQVIQIEQPIQVVNDASDQVTFIGPDVLQNLAVDNNQQVVYLINVHDEEQAEVIQEIQPVIEVQETDIGQTIFIESTVNDEPEQNLSFIQGQQEVLEGQAELQAAAALVQYAMFGSSTASAEGTHLSGK